MAVRGLLVAAPPFVDGAEVGQRDGLAPAVADRGRRGQRLLVVVGCLLVAALPPADDAEVGERDRLGGAVAEQAGRVVRVAVDGHRVGVVAAGLQVAVQGGGQPGGVSPASPGRRRARRPRRGWRVRRRARRAPGRGSPARGRACRSARGGAGSAVRPGRGRPWRWRRRPGSSRTGWSSRPADRSAPSSPRRAHGRRRAAGRACRTGRRRPGGPGARGPAGRARPWPGWR